MLCSATGLLQVYIDRENESYQIVEVSVGNGICIKWGHQVSTIANVAANVSWV